MDAAGPVDGANGRAAHEVLGNRFAIPTSTHSPNRQSLKRKMSDTINPSTELGQAQSICAPG